MSKYFYYSKSGRVDLSEPTLSGSDSQVKTISFNEGESFGVGEISSLRKNPLIKGTVNQVSFSASHNYANDIVGPKIKIGSFELQIRLDLSQPVNQWLCVLLLGCITLSVVLFYFATQAEDVLASGSTLLQ